MSVMRSAERVSLTYALDAYRSRCDGFVAALRDFAGDDAHRIRLAVRSAGLHTGARVRQVAAHPHPAAERDRTARPAGAVFGRDPALGRGTTGSAARIHGRRPGLRTRPAVRRRPAPGPPSMT
ncbi:hypothetical protein [Streptomyces qinzhouensis]|uniref:Uncharacterized protein n=1 Tax=Streptomyces qinzhouensis TaxID=2599401 RepID=A0A5B8JIZ8_9ACTN|nr:hypothetical protein [Streptomyces qinzhouensis]QDY80384.1 hypothetical protein FQU76_32075 [Streptomyces qinzhouensis]